MEWTFVSDLKRLPLEMARWLLLAALIFAPWAYGCTRYWSKEMLTVGLLGISGLGLWGFLVQRRWPRCQPLVIFPMLALLIQGWVMTLNPRFLFDPEYFVYYELIKRVSWLPGGVDQEVSAAQMRLITGLFGAFILASDFSINFRWLQRLWFVLAATGVSVVALGIAQKVTGASAIFWEWGVQDYKTIFATYRYHGNAGAFINLVLPFLLGAMFLAFRSDQFTKRVLWSMAAFIVAGGAFINTSRAAMVISSILLAGWGGFAWYLIRRSGVSRRFALSSVLLLLVGVVMLIWAFGGEQTISRWIQGMDNLPNNGRYIVYRAIWENAIPVSGYCGFGPGTFQITFPYFTGEFSEKLAGIWRYAHQDYLQTIMEWGYFGFLLWVWFFLGNFWLIIQALPEQRPLNCIFFISSLCALGSILIHALVDFPLQIASLQLYTAVILGATGGITRVQCAAPFSAFSTYFFKTWRSD